MTARIDSYGTRIEGEQYSIVSKRDYLTDSITLLLMERSESGWKTVHLHDGSILRLESGTTIPDDAYTYRVPIGAVELVAALLAGADPATEQVNAVLKETLERETSRFDKMLEVLLHNASLS